MENNQELNKKLLDLLITLDHIYKDHLKELKKNLYYCYTDFFENNRIEEINNVKTILIKLLNYLIRQDIESIEVLIRLEYSITLNADYNQSTSLFLKDIEKAYFKNKLYVQK